MTAGAARVFLAGLLIVAIVAALESAPKLLVLGGSQLAARPGSFTDNSSVGFMEAGRVLASHGYHLLHGMGPVNGYSSVVYLVAGPMECSPDAAGELAKAILLQAANASVGVIVASSDPYNCGQLVLEALGVQPPLYVESLSGAYLVLGAPGDSSVLWALYSPERVEPTSGWRVAAWMVGASGRAPGVLVGEFNGLRVVYIPSWSAFSNALLRAELRAGELFEPDRAVLAIFSYAAGGGSGAVVLPVNFLPGPAGGEAAPLLAFQPAVLAGRAAEAYTGFESRVYSVLSSNIVAAAIVAWVVSFAVLAVLHFGFGGSPPGVREPLLEAQGAAGRFEYALDGSDAAELLDAVNALLLLRSGVSVVEAVREPPEVLRRAAARLGVSVDALVEALESALRGRIAFYKRRRVLRLLRELVDVLAFVEEG